MQYMIAEEDNAKDLMALVNEYLEEGWALQGGVSVCVDQGRTSYVQALIKKD